MVLGQCTLGVSAVGQRTVRLLRRTPTPSPTTLAFTPYLSTLFLHLPHRVGDFLQLRNYLQHPIIHLLEVFVIRLSSLPSQLDILFCFFFEVPFPTIVPAACPFPRPTRRSLQS